MNLDWNRVKEHTLWSYEALIEKLQAVLAYRFVQEHYNHTPKQAQEYAARLRMGYLQDKGEMADYLADIARNFADLEQRWQGTYLDLIRAVATRTDCVAFLTQTGFEFDALIQILQYLLRWGLPFKSPLREFIEEDQPGWLTMLAALKQQGIHFNLDLLEVARTRTGRERLAGQIGLPEPRLLELVHRVDIARLAYVRGKTVKHLCGGGYGTLELIAQADLADMEARMDAYYHTLGKSLANFKAVIPLPWMIGGARVLPRLVEA